MDPFLAPLASGRGLAAAPRGVGRGPTRRGRRTLSVHITYLLPAWLLVAAVVVAPLALSVWMSLRNETMLRNGKFIGLSNFAEVLTGDFWPALWITLVFSLAAMLVQVPLGLAGVASMIGLPGLNWLGDRTLAIFSVVLVDAWQNIPFVMLLSLAGLQSLPDAPLEAAKVDGATAWQSFWYVTIPMLTPVLGVVVMIRIIESIKLFDIIYILTQGGPGTATQNLSVLNYRMGFSFMNTSEAAALGIVICIVLIPVFWLQKKVNEQ